MKGITEWGKDIDTTVEPIPTPSVENLYIIPWSLKLSYFESLLSDSAFNQASSGQNIGYFTTSAIDRFLTSIGIKHDIDIFVIDTGPSLGALNRAILLGTDYFITPVMADAFSVQWVENIGEQLSRWIEHWRLTAEAVARSPEKNIPADHLLRANPLFIGYIVNNFNVYAKKTIQRQDEWKAKLPNKVKEYLSIRHSRNGLIARSSEAPIGSLQDYGQLTPISMDLCKPIQDISPKDDQKLNLQGTKELAEKARDEIKDLAKNIIDILQKY